MLGTQSYSPGYTTNSSTAATPPEVFVDDANFETCEQCSSSKKPYHTAAINGHLSCLKSLCHGKDKEYRERVLNKKIEQKTPLHEALTNKHDECAVYLISKQSNTQIKDGDSQTPLMLAVFNDLVGATEKLVFEKTVTKLHFCETDSFNVMHITAANGCHKVLKWLIQKHPKLMQSRSQGGWLPIHCTASNGHIDCLRLLLDGGSPVNEVDFKNQTPLHLAALSGRKDCVFELLNRKAILHDSVQFLNRSVLHLACTRDSPELVSALISGTGSNPLIPDNDGLIPLHLAAVEGCAQTVRCLLGITPRTPVDSLNMKTGRTALHYACENRRYKAAVLLIDEKANINAVDNNGDTPLLLCSNFAKGTFSPFSCDIIDQLLSRGADPNAADKDGHTVIHYLSITTGFGYNAYNQLRTLLYHCGAVANVRNCQGKTPLHLMVDQPFVWVYEPTIDMLLQKAPELINLKDSNGATPLHIACMASHVVHWENGNSGRGYNLIQTLLRRGADPHAQDNHGDTPLHFFMQTLNSVLLKEEFSTDLTAIIKLIIDNSYLLTIQNNDGKTPVDYLQDSVSYRDHPGVTYLKKCCSLLV
eukprot:Nk52_evm123s226 gene=Nk52_evmTU123s226